MLRFAHVRVNNNIMNQSLKSPYPRCDKVGNAKLLEILHKE